MRIKKVTLFTDELEKQKDFYSNILGFKIIKENFEMFSIQVGWSILIFRSSLEKFYYHFAFLIPSNLLIEGKNWLENRLHLIDIGNESNIVKFETWNAESIYFYDAAGNVLEFIVRYDLKNNRSKIFDISNILCVNEIGIPTNDVSQINSLLEQNFETYFWKGDLDRFAANGSEEGLFLIPNIELKKVWFPTEVEIERSPFEIIFENNCKVFQFKYSNGEILPL